MKVWFPHRLLLALCLLVLAVGNAAAKTDTLRYIGKITKNDTTSSVKLFEKFHWFVIAKFKDGTSRSCLTSAPDTIFKSKKLKSALFTTDFIVDTSLRNKIISLHYELEGSVNISINKSTILATGVYAPAGADRRQSGDEFMDLLLSEKFVRMQIDYLPSRSNKLKFEAALYQKQAAEKKIKDKIEEANDDNRAGFYYLAFGIVFIILFAFLKEKKEHLYFSLFCMFAALSFLWDGLETDILNEASSFWGIYCFEFLSIFFCKILRNKEKSKKPLLAITVGMLLCLLPPVKYGSMPLLRLPAAWLLVTIIVSAYLYVIASVIYYLIKGIGQKRWEARAILIVCLAPLVLYVVAFFIFIIVIAFKANSGDVEITTSSLFDYLSTTIVYLYPLAAVFILGRRNGMNQRKLIAQVKSIKQLSEDNLAKETEKKEILEKQKDVLEDEVLVRTSEILLQKERIEKQHEELKLEKEKSEELLRNILPEEVAEELKQNGTIAAKHYDDVSVLFTDFVNFTKAGEQMSPQDLIDELHTCFKAFDEITAKYSIEKIKTIGDAYLAVAGLPSPDPKHAENIVKAAREITAFMKERLGIMGPQSTFQVRVGIHSGSVVAGIVGVKKFAYDIWGDTVNTAARMEQNSEAGKINISQTTYELVKDKFTCEFRGEIDAKGKGVMKMYYVS